jgi:hypothetical protein
MNRLPQLMIFLLLVFPSAVPAADQLPLLNEVAQSTAALQPGLESYQATVHTDRIATTIEAMTANIPADLPRPEVPTVLKFWRRGAPRSVIIASGAQTAPLVQQMVQRISASLAIEPEELLLPPGKAAERQRLAAQATIKSTEISLVDTVLQRVDLSFATPADVAGAFYGNGLRLPQSGISRLLFDIDVSSRTVRELTVQTAAGDQLTAEFHYRPVNGGQIAERVRVTSPDGKIDDRLEVTYTEVSGYLLPQKTVRQLQRPDLQDHLEVTFSGYRVNQQFPAEVEAQFASQGKPAVSAP